jgi:protein involved in polysaccharide export with SLBB domain
MKFKVLVLFALAVLASQISFAQETIVTADGGRGYLIGPGDVLTIRVLGEPEFAIESVTVDEDGKIEVPFSTTPVLAKCRSEKELRVDVAKLLKAYGLRNPQTTVYVKTRNSRPPATIYGEIRSPQRIELTRKATLKDLLAFSGGVTEKASGMIQITRTQPLLCAEGADDDWNNFNSNGAGLPSRLYSVGSLRETNPTIYPGDIIDIQKAAPIYVVGEVMKSGELVMPEGGLPLMQAVAMAGGTTREARTKEVKVYRRKQGSAQPEVISVNYEGIKKGSQKDIMLEPYDIIEVGKAKKSVFDIVLDIATGGVRNMVNTLPVRY